MGSARRNTDRFNDNCKYHMHGEGRSLHTIMCSDQILSRCVWWNNRNMWHWERIIDGPFKGGWVHPYFVRGNKMLCTYMSRHGIPNPDMIQYLLSSENTSAFHTSSPFLQNSEPNVSMKSHNERIDFPPATNPGLSNPLKMISSTYKAIDEDWDPIPVAPFVENDFNSFGGPQLSVHFVDPSSEILSLCESAQSILEPTPFRETADDTSRLLEPLSYETIDNLFWS